MQRRRVDGDLLQSGDVREMLDNERGGDPAQIKALAAREDGRQDLFGIGRGEHELHVRGGLFQGF